MEKVFIPHDDEAAVVSSQGSISRANNQCSSQIEKQDKDFLSKEEIWHGLIIFFVGAGLGLVVFLISYFSLSYFDINYLLSAVLAIVISIFILSALNEAMGAKKSKMQSPILMILFIAFVFTVLIGYANHGSPFNSRTKEGQSYKSETFIFTGKERWATKVTFRRGQTYRVKVEGVSVNKVNGSNWIELAPSVNYYLYTVDSPGAPTFDGIAHGNGSRSTVTVEWME